MFEIKIHDYFNYKERLFHCQKDNTSTTITIRNYWFDVSNFSLKYIKIIFFDYQTIDHMLYRHPCSITPLQ